MHVPLVSLKMWSESLPKCGSNISKTSASVSSGFQTRETFETTRPQAEWFYCFQAFGNPMKHEAQVFEITSPTKKISLNYHLNKFSQFNYYIWDMKYAWTSKKCVWCAWSYHLIAALWQFLNIQQLRSCYLAACQFWANILLHKTNGRVSVNQNTRSPPLSENFNLEKNGLFRFGFSSMGGTTVSGFLLWFLINLLWYCCGIN